MYIRKQGLIEGRAYKSKCIQRLACLNTIEGVMAEKMTLCKPSISWCQAPYVYQEPILSSSHVPMA